jgi:hypothetical protein
LSDERKCEFVSRVKSVVGVFLKMRVKKERAKKQGLRNENVFVWVRKTESEE